MIPFFDIASQYNRISCEIKSAVQVVLEHGQYVLGPEVSLFEQEFATYCGVDHAIAVNSGTSALHLALLAGGIGQGDEVITTPMTFVATVAAIMYTGAKPVLVDVDPVTWTLDPTKIAEKISSRTKAIIPVHLHGLCAEMNPILEIAHKRNLLVVEDAAQAHGAEYKGRRSGSIGHIGCFSFYPSKNLGALGEGGACVTNDVKYADKIRALRDWGAKRKYFHETLGFNYRLDTLQCAALRVKLKYIEEWTESRRANAALFDRKLRHLCQIPAPPGHSRHVYHVYSICVWNRDELQNFLRDNEIGTSIHYPVPVHLQAGYRFGEKGDFPVSEERSRTFLSLPMYPELTEAHIGRITRAIETFFEGKTGHESFDHHTRLQ